MVKLRTPLSAALGALLLCACGSSSQTSLVPASTAHGTLAQNPPFRIASLDAATFKAELSGTGSGAQLLQLAGSPSCGVDFYYIQFWTVGGAGEITESSGALMVPTGGAPACSGPRPMVLYAHGTNTDKTLNIADITNTSNAEGALIAAMFAAQGYIVVAPNYAGYDISTLGYHPFLNAQQQSGEMIDSLTAARAALPKTLSSATSDSGKLFVTGYSEGGYVALATQRALQASGAVVAGSAPMSGPYALEAFGDVIFFGNVNLGSTVFSPLLSTSYQKAYGNIYSTPSDLYSSNYAKGIETLLPSALPLGTIFANGLLPETALFNSTTPVVSVPGNPVLSAELTALLLVPGSPGYPIPSTAQTPLFAAGFGSPYLINNSYRVSYVLDAASDPDGAVPVPLPGVPLAAAVPKQPLREAFYKNDLRNGTWAPTSPTLLCGGNADPTVFFSVNTQTMAAFWSAQVHAGLITVLDVGAAPAGPFAALQTGFQQSQAAQLAFYESAAGGGFSPAAAEQLLVQGYHGSVAPFCTAAARAFFSQL
ncbi:MAG TPA: prolyl oligopeptidase family serine peptidase [Steroidobacteraceae bacterium]|nr:prolyl oligopeptidase family serine peptidase [Steroidobacteraceae bacterium]